MGFRVNDNNIIYNLCSRDISIRPTRKWINPSKESLESGS